MASKRKTKYETNVLPKLKVIEGWARDGLTDEKIAHNVGVAYSTFRDYRDKYSALSAALKNGKDDIDVDVENSLVKSALGFEYDETTMERDIVTGKMVVTKIVRKQVTPNPTSIIYWLNNRRPAVWRNKREVENSFKGADFVLTVEATDETDT